MVAKTKPKKKTVKKVKQKCLHVWDIPAKYFPRVKGNKSRLYQQELIRMMNNLRYTNQGLQYSAQVCCFNIRSIDKKSGFNPSRPEVFRAIEEFVYHYENFCYRSFSFREKLLQFINSFLPVGFEEEIDVKVKSLLVNPVVKQAKLKSLIEKFSKNKILKSVIDDRHSLTHKLYYGASFDHFLRPQYDNPPKNQKEFKKWLSDWKKEIEVRAKQGNAFMYVVSDMNHKLTEKVITYKESLK